MIARHVSLLMALLVSNSTGTVAQSGTQAQVRTAPTAPPNSAPPPAPRKLTLAAAIDAAQANYPRVRAAVEQQNAAQATIGVARTAYLPRIDMLWQTNRATANNIYGLLLPQ